MFRRDLRDNIIRKRYQHHVAYGSDLHNRRARYRKVEEGGVDISILKRSYRLWLRELLLAEILVWVHTRRLKYHQGKKLVTAALCSERDLFTLDVRELFDSCSGRSYQMLRSGIHMHQRQKRQFAVIFECLRSRVRLIQR